MDLFAGCGGMTRGFVDTRPLRTRLRRRDGRARGRHLRRELRRSTTSSPTRSRASRRFPRVGRRHRRPALPGLLAAQPRRRRLRTPRTLARIPPRAPRERAGGVRDGERPRTPPLAPSTRPSRSAAERRARLSRRGAGPQRRRLRRAAAPPTRDRHRRSRRGDPLAEADPPRSLEGDPARTASRGARSATR